MRQIGLLFGLLQSAPHWVIDSLGPVAGARCGPQAADRPGSYRGRHFGTDAGSPVAAPPKNFRYSANVQVAFDAGTRLVTATGEAQLGYRNDCTVYRDSEIAGELAERPR